MSFEPSSHDDCLPLSFLQELPCHKALIVKLLTDSIDETSTQILKGLALHDEFIGYLAEACCSEQDVDGTDVIRIVMALKSGYGSTTVDDDPLQLTLFALWRLTREVRETRRYVEAYPGYTSLN
jgi:hypothetical protein